MFENVEPVVIVRGLQSPEGPSVDRQGLLHFVDWDAKWIYRIDPNGRLAEWVNTGGMPTGSKFHADGRLFVADGDAGILAVTPAGEVSVAADAWREGRFKGPNDLVFASNGDLYFTDPRESDPDHPIGNVLILRASGSVECFAGGFQFPNGIVLSADGRTLFLAETFPNHILAFDLDEEGRERSRRVFAQLEGGLGPDGMAFDQAGNLYVAHFGKGVVAVIDPAGKVIAKLPAGGMNPTNVAFSAGSLFVTEVEHGQIVRLDLGVEGLPLYGQS